MSDVVGRAAGERIATRDLNERTEREVAQQTTGFQEFHGEASLGHAQATRLSGLGSRGTEF